MTFIQRLKRFLVGVAIGVILTGVFFKDRLSVFTSWLPENVVKSKILERPIYTSDTASCQLEYYNIPPVDFASILQESDVLFSESQVRIKPKEYVFLTEDELYKFSVRADSMSSRLMQITAVGQEEVCLE